MYGGFQGSPGYAHAQPAPGYPYGVQNAVPGPSSYGAYNQVPGPAFPPMQATQAIPHVPQQSQPVSPLHDPYVIANDPAAYERLFREHLSTLTFNSKQIINTLTMMADDHKERMSSVVARTLDSHIVSCPPQYRLPAMYLLDSICKNIGYPYTTLWAPHIARLFMDTYRLVDVAVRRKLEDLLATWRDAGTGGSPLFGAEAQSSIERNLFGNSYSPPPPKPQPPQVPVASPMPLASPPPPQPSRLSGLAQNLLGRIDVQLRAAYRDSPNNPDASTRIVALQGLQQVIQPGTLHEQELRTIDAQLREMETGAQQARSTGGLPPSLVGALNSLSSDASSARPPSSDATQDLFSKLMASGLLGLSNALGPGAKVEEQDDAYMNAIMAIDLKLTVHDLQRQPPSVDLLLHKHLPSQCKQCARRFPSSDKGQRSMDEHLDWHFRQKQRVKDSLARGQSRQWFPKLAEFIRGGFDDSPPGRRNIGDGEDDEGEGEGLTAEQEKALKAKFATTYVIAPTDPDVAAKPCPICKESFKSVYNEDEEEWVWYDAIEVNGTYYHASCHYSAKSLSASVQREGTPTVDGDSVMRSRSATPVTSMKTKEESVTSADPVSRIKSEEGVPSPKRKREDLGDTEGPVADAEEPQTKKPALEQS